ncbi:hypothetical protein [Occallatibacter riparius]|uniref:Uncharacterized protein n=1 Tax=Occallatibacter riparius TaxID=1002689 RepID=A0A9J7BGY9_9BACT|nr:hypothetical protein [Occallatibacter riparius]UWZ82007.1 hypothetical protein MOP44_15655 [Occallatibacter riparius]
MGRRYCRTCEALKEFYWLKVNQFLLAVRTSSAWPQRRRLDDEELQALKDESLAAFRELLRHAKACYGLVRDEAA